MLSGLDTAITLPRTCSSCGIGLLVGSSPRRKFCDSCKRKVAVDRVARWRDANPEKLAAQRNKSQDNKAKARAWTKAWIQAHPEKMCAYYKRWYVENQDALRLLYSERRARYAASDFKFEDWLSILEVFGHRCAYCLQIRKLTRDHVRPISRGGVHTADNIVPACRSCNSRKNNRSLFVMPRSTS